MMTMEGCAAGRRRPVEEARRPAPMMVSAGMWTLTGGAPDSHWHIERERYVRYSVTMQNMRGQALPRVELWICAPLREASTQQVRTMKSSPPCEEIRDSLGNHLLRFVFHNVAPFAVRIATVEATLELSPAPAGAGGAGLWGGDPLSEISEERLPWPIPRFPGAATEETVREIFDWVRGCRQEAGGGGRKSGGASTWHGCEDEEHAKLFAALCRRSGIPARAMGGYRSERDPLLDPAVPHCWAEYHLDGRWRFADPHAGVHGDPGDRYVATRILGESDSAIGRHDRYCVLGEGVLSAMDR